MKKLFSVLLIVTLLCVGAAMAETAQENTGDVVTGNIMNGTYEIQIPVDADDTGEWHADEMAQDDSVVRLVSAEVKDGVFVAVYEAVGDGDITVNILHYTGIACDKVHGFDLRVKDGQVVESFGGMYTESPAEEELDPALSGSWLEKDTQFTEMTITKNPEGGWNLEIVSPVTHGSYCFKATAYYDCELNALVYSDGAWYDIPLTDAEEYELGEPVRKDTTGSLSFISKENEEVALSWYHSDEGEPTEVVFEPVQG